MAAAAAVKSTIDDQTHTLRGSACSQSLAADLANQVFQAFEAEGMDPRQGGGDLGGGTASWTMTRRCHR